MDASLLAHIADVLPQHLRHAKRDTNPWGVTTATLQGYNSANGTTFTAADLVAQGRTIALWLLQRIEADLARAGAAKGREPRPVDVVTGYVGGWGEIAKAYRGQPYSSPSAAASKMAQGIVTDAAAKQREAEGSSLPEPDLAPIPGKAVPTASKLTRQVVSRGKRPDFKMALWAVGSFASLPLAVWLVNRKRR